MIKLYHKKIIVNKKIKIYDKINTGEPMKTKKKLKVKWKNLFILTVILISFITLIISSINIIKWLIDSSNTKDEVKKLEEIVKVEEVKDNENTEIIEQPTEPPKENPYWDYIKMNLINVDFKELKKINIVLSKEQLDLKNGNKIILSFGNKDTTEHPGGFNIFGKEFGDYPQDIILTCKYDD